MIGMVMNNAKIQIFCLLLHLSQCHGAQEESTLAQQMHEALVDHRDPKAVENCLHQGYKLAQFHSNPDKIYKKSFDQHQLCVQWMHQYFTYPQPGNCRSKNLMELLLMHERRYKITDKKLEFLLIGTMLIEYGADVQATGFDKNTIAHILATFPHNVTTYFAQMNLLQKLSDHGANMNWQNKYGDTPLHSAVQADQPESMLRLMINAGGNMHALNHGNQSPYDFASPQKKYEILLYPLLSKKTCTKDQL